MAAANVALSSEPAFSMLVLGCGGGPSEDDLSAFWIKPAEASWRDGFTSVDGGSCLGALRRLLQLYPQSFTQERGWTLPRENGGSALANAGTIFRALESFLITHAHWDHIAGLVLSSQSVSPSNPKYVYGTQTTLSHLSSFAMNGHLWPSLGSYSSPDAPSTSSTPYIYRKVVDKSQWIYPSKGLRAKAMPISHGEGEERTAGGKGKERFASTAYLIELVTEEVNGHGVASGSGGKTAHPRSCMVFGDLEADSVSGETYNRDIWEAISPRIAEGSLSSIFIECSYCSERAPERLYGHLSPVYIFEELRVLAGLISPVAGAGEGDLRGRLSGLTLGIMHVKEATSVETLPPLDAAVHSTHADTRNGNSSINGQADSFHSAAAPAATPKHELPSSSVSQAKRRRKASAEADLDQTAPTRRRTRSAAGREAQEQSSAPQCRIEPPPLPNGLVTERYALKQEDEEPQRVYPESIKARIEAELLALEEKERLGVKFLMLEQGMQIEF